jgi:hypothetical protein
MVPSMPGLPNESKTFCAPWPVINAPRAVRRIDAARLPVPLSPLSLCCCPSCNDLANTAE